jgi:hypothetical protein
MVPPALAPDAAVAECGVGTARRAGPAEARTAKTTQTITAASAHMSLVKRRFNRPQSANSSGFIVPGITLRLTATRPPSRSIARRAH